MKISRSSCLLTILLFSVVYYAIEVNAESDYITCYNRDSKCFHLPMICPDECPKVTERNPKTKVCYVDCYSPLCELSCKYKKPNCNGPGAACYDPRFIGADGIVFYFHGKKNEHFSLVSDPKLQINARFIGLRPAGRPRDFTWIQALGILFDTHTISVEATKSTTWDDEVDHLRFAYNGLELGISEGFPSIWESSEKSIKVERTANKNSALITLPEVAEISVNVVSVTKEDDRIHSYRIPDDDCFAHLEVQFRFYSLSSKVEGVLGRTYQPDFVNPAKPGVLMPVVGGENKYRTSSLLSTDCNACVFSPGGILNEEDSIVKEDSFINCSGGLTSGNGIVCRK